MDFERIIQQCNPKCGCCFRISREIQKKMVFCIKEIMYSLCSNVDGSWCFAKERRQK